MNSMSLLLNGMSLLKQFSNPGPPSTYANLVTSHEELKTLVTLVYEDTTRA